jgi:hypothetical protein
VLSTTTGDLGLRIPTLWAGTFLWSLLERRRVAHALYAEMMEDHLHGVSTR